MRSPLWGWKNRDCTQKVSVTYPGCPGSASSSAIAAASSVSSNRSASVSIQVRPKTWE